MKETYTLDEVKKIKRAANLAGYEEGYGKGLEEGTRISNEAWESVINGNHPSIWTEEDIKEQEEFLRKAFASMIPEPLHPREDKKTTETNEGRG